VLLLPLNVGFNVVALARAAQLAVDGSYELDAERRTPSTVARCPSRRRLLAVCRPRPVVRVASGARAGELVVAGPELRQKALSRAFRELPRGARTRHASTPNANDSTAGHGHVPASGMMLVTRNSWSAPVPV
jgi:hypothetical protein